MPLTPSAMAVQKRQVAVPPRYRLKEVLGEGGMGKVYRAHDTTMGRDVAIKVLEQDLPGPDKTQQRERFVREARAAARLLHPNIVAVHDVDPDAGWLVMELVEGQSLRDAAGGAPMAPAVVRSIAEQVLGALDAAHAAGVIHRDVKPSNIILSPAGKATLVDFGVARLVDAEMTRTGEGLGTPAYMAPEQIRGVQVDARSDLYALAATLYELVTGGRMVAFEELDAAAFAHIEAACAGDERLARTIAQCLATSPLRRPPSAKEALAMLRGDGPRASGLRPRSEVAQAGRRPRARLWFAVAAVAIAGAGIGAFAVLRTPSKGQDPRLTEAFTIAQRGENERAGQLLEAYLVENPDDVDALTTSVLVSWWATGDASGAIQRALAAHLRPEQRALVHGIDLIVQRREQEAIALLQGADREHPHSPEILYALGEAQWHGQHLDDGAATLAQAFQADPHWEVALHHVVEYALSSGHPATLTPIANALRTVDAPAASALDCRILVSQQRTADAIALADKAIAAEPIPELYICKAQAQALSEDLIGGEATAKTAFEQWPIDLREWGGFAQYAEFQLYRGHLDDYLALIRGKPSRQRGITLAMWKPDAPEMAEGRPVGPGMRVPPLGAAMYIYEQHLAGKDAVDVYGDYPEPEVQAFGKGLYAETHHSRLNAIAFYRHALEVPSKGDIRMLVAHQLAGALYAEGDSAGATEACREVIAPRLYDIYRAVVLPDCLAWSNDPAGWQRLVTTWATAQVDLPALALAKKRLAGK